jgi:hypothetical protein
LRAGQPFSVWTQSDIWTQKQPLAGSIQTEMSAYQTILDEIETGLASGNVRHRLKLLQRVTDLFVAGSRP